MKNKEDNLKDCIVKVVRVIAPEGMKTPPPPDGSQLYEDGMIEELDCKELKQFGAIPTAAGPVMLMGSKPGRAFEAISQVFDSYEDLALYIKNNKGILIYQAWKSNVSHPKKYRIRFYGNYNQNSDYGPLCLTKLDACIFNNVYNHKKRSMGFIRNIPWKLAHKYFSWRRYDKVPRGPISDEHGMRCLRDIDLNDVVKPSDVTDVAENIDRNFESIIKEENKNGK